MKRQEVYQVIDSERDYQEYLIKKNNWDEDKSVGAFLTILRGYLRKAEDAWLSESDKEEDRPSLAQIRKIAAVAVATIEQHGAPKRITQLSTEVQKIKTPSDCKLIVTTSKKGKKIKYAKLIES